MGLAIPKAEVKVLSGLGNPKSGSLRVFLERLMGLDEAKPGSDCWLSLQTLLNPQNKEVRENTCHLRSKRFLL